MQPIAPYPGRIDQQVGEPAYSLLIRTLEHNGTRRIPAALDRVMGAKGRAVHSLSPEEVARICKADAVAVRYATPVMRSTIAVVMGQVVSAEHVSLRARRWCPRCLDEQPYHRVWWDILPVTSCPMHGIKLVTSCGCKGRGLQWRSNRLQSCRKGHVLAKVACEVADPDVLALDDYVIGRICGDGQIRPALLDDVPLGELLTLCERLGKAAFDENATLYEVRRRHGVGPLHAEGFRILLGMPETFEDLLDRLRADENMRPGGEGLHKSYGTLYEFIRELPDSPLVDGLRQKLFEHADGNFAIQLRKQFRNGVAPVEALTLSEASDAVGLTHQKFRDLLDRLGIPYRARQRGKGAGYRTEINRIAFDAIRAKLEGYRTLNRLARELGLGNLDVTDLAAAGLVEVIAPGHAARDWIFPADAAGGLIARLLAKSGRLNRGDWGFLPLPRVAKACGTSVADAVALVLNGAVEARVGSGKRLKVPSFRIRSEALTRHLTNGGDGDRAPSVVARELGLNQATLGAVVSAGLLDTRRTDEAIRMPARDVERFRMTYATMRELKRAMGVSAFQPVVATLDAAGIRPVAQANRLGDRIYPRHAAMEACIKSAGRQPNAPLRGESRLSVARGLGMTKTMLKQLVGANFIAMQEGCPFGSIAATEIARFTGAYVTSPELSRTFGIRSPKMTLAILSNANVRPVCGRPEFHYTLFRRQEAEEAMRDKAAADSSAPVPVADDDAEPTMGVAEVAKRLDTSPNMVNSLVRTSLLPPIRTPVRGQRTLVRISEVERFARTYVFANELARLAGRKHRHGNGRAVTAKLLADGIRPICSRPEFTLCLFERNEALALMHRLGYLSVPDA